MQYLTATKCFVFALLLSLSALVQADFRAAMKIYEEERFAEARVAFEALAAIGDRESLFNLGVMHYRGESVPGDAPRGYALMFLANKDYNAEHLGAIVAKVHASFSEEQRQAAMILVEQLSEQYDIQTVEGRIYPVLLDDADCEPELAAEIAVAPKYPRREQLRGQMGYSLTQFTISPQGYVRDVVMVSSVTKEFSKTSAKAAKRFRYAPPADGKPIYGHLNMFTYSLTDGGNKMIKLRTSGLRKDLEATLAAAESGDVVAQFKYANSLRELKSFESSLKKLDLQYRDANTWFEKSAKGGLPHAQFELGHNMMKGIGCEVDRENGMKWVKAAAVSGYSPAQQLLAREIAVRERTDDNNLAIVSWLRNAALSGYYPAKVQLAWELSTSATASLHDPEEALELLGPKPENYYDDVRLLETEAAAKARLGEYKRAIKLQKKAISRAEDLDWSIPAMHDRLGLYEHGEPWTGSYY